MFSLRSMNQLTEQELATIRILIKTLLVRSRNAPGDRLFGTEPILESILTKLTPD